MHTEFTLLRPFLGKPIRQKHRAQALSASDLVLSSNEIRTQLKKPLFSLQDYLSLPSSKQFITEVELKYGWATFTDSGRSGDMWVHPMVFIDIALVIFPKFKLETYDWLLNLLLQYYDRSKASYLKRYGICWVKVSDKKQFSRFSTDKAVEMALTRARKLNK